MNESIIKVKNLWKVYEGNIIALKGVDLNIYSKEIVAIMGANGSGKTTLVKHFNGLLKPSKGEVIVYGVNTRKASVSQLARKIGLVFQNPDHQIFSYTIWDEVTFGLKNLGYDKEEISIRASEALKAVDLFEFRERHPHAISRGQRQRLGLATALAMETDVLVLDEPTTGQDIRARRQIMNMMSKLNRRGRTIIVVTHDMNLIAEYATRTIVMNQGQVVLDGPTKDVFLRDDLIMNCGLQPPIMNILAKRLAAFGVPQDVLTIDHMFKVLTTRLSVPLQDISGANTCQK